MDAFNTAVLSGDPRKVNGVLTGLSPSDLSIAASTDSGKLAVYLASTHDESLLNYLFKANFDASYVSDTGETALHMAVKQNRPNSVALLLASSTCLPNATDGHQQTPLHRACELGFEECIQLLVEDERVAIDAEDAWSRTALHWVARKGLLETTKKLLDRGAKALTTVTKETPLHWAVRGGNSALIQLLLTHHPDLSVYSLNERMETPLDLARSSNMPNDILHILEAHAQAHGQVAPTLNTVINESQVHDTGAKPMAVKPKGGVKKLTIKKPSA